MPDRSPPPLRLGFNAALLSLSHDYRAAGIHRYITALLDALAGCNGLSLTLFVAGPAARDVARERWPAADVRAAPALVARPAGRIVWEQAGLPLALARAGVDLLHGPAHAIPAACPVPAVVTVHDLSFFRLPEAFPRAQGAYLRAATRQAVRLAAAVIAVSEFTRRELIDLLGVHPARIQVVPNGCDPTCRPLPGDAVESWRARVGLPPRFVLALGTRQPRKNLGTLVEAYARLRARRPDAPDLVIAGAPGWGADDVGRRVDRLGLAAHVHRVGYVPAADLPYLYNAAALLAFPSWYEGFGLPVVEAMACGTPVVVAAASSLPEVAGSAGIAVPPGDVDGWTLAMDAVLSDADRAATLRSAGLARAARFTWRRAALATLAIYGQALAPGATPGAWREAEAPDGGP